MGSPTVALINALNPLIRGWSQYFCIGVVSEVFTDLDNFMYERAQRYPTFRSPLSKLMNVQGSVEGSS